MDQVKSFTKVTSHERIKHFSWKIPFYSTFQILSHDWLSILKLFSLSLSLAFHSHCLDRKELTVIRHFLYRSRLWVRYCGSVVAFTWSFVFVRRIGDVNWHFMDGFYSRVYQWDWCVTNWNLKRTYVVGFWSSDWNLEILIISNNLTKNLKKSCHWNY